MIFRHPDTMTLLIITTLLFSGLCNLSSSVPRQFHVVREQKTWTEAQQYCREEFTDLATIEDKTENEKVKSLIHDAGVSLAWIGLKQGSNDKWEWSLDDKSFYDKDEAQFRNWATGHPRGDGWCVCKTRDGKWWDASCWHRHPFICYDGKNPRQPYVRVTDTKNWADAQRYCREKDTDLASVRNQTENDQMPSASGLICDWIGLSRKASWLWSDGSSSSFRHWTTGQLNYVNAVELCAKIGSSGLWNYENCHHQQHHFICYEDKLVLVNESKTWNEALQHCRGLSLDLVSVRSEGMQHWVTELAKGASTAHVWLGLRYACGAGWFWVWGETVCYSNWAAGADQVQGCQSVGAMKSGGDGGQWVSRPETEKLSFICATDDED